MRLEIWRFLEDIRYFLKPYLKAKLLVQFAAKLYINWAIDELFSYIFRRENKFFVCFFQILKFGTSVYWSFFEQNRGYSFFTHF
jgi:hypothetical protein